MSDMDRDTGAKDKMGGTVDQLKGRGEQAIGGITGDREQQGKGMLDEAKGKVQEGIGNAKDALNNDNNS